MVDNALVYTIIQGRKSKTEVLNQLNERLQNHLTNLQNKLKEENVNYKDIVLNFSVIEKIKQDYIAVLSVEDRKEVA